MSTVPSHQPQAGSQEPSGLPRDESAMLARRRAAAVRRRISLAADALAAADLLLGVHASVRSVGSEPPGAEK